MDSISSTSTQPCYQSDTMTDDTAKLLATGILEVYEPSLVTVKTHLKELTDRQESVLASLTSERKRLEDLSSDAVSDALIANVAISRERLVAVSNSMISLHRRVNSLQKRAANIEKAARSKKTQNNKTIP